MVRLKAGTKHAGFVMESGKGLPRQTVTLVGLNSSGQLGKFPSIDPNTGDIAPPAWTHHSWALPVGAIVHSLALGRQHSVALVQDSTGSRQIWTAGSNNFGQSLAPKPSLASAWHPIPLPLHDVVQVATGYDHTVLLHADGTVSTSGWSTDGQTGQGHLHSFSPWLPLRSILGKDIGRIVAGADHALAVAPGGDPVWSWGNSEYGQCMTGEGPVDRVPSPTRVKLPDDMAGRRVVDVACSASASVLALADPATEGARDLWYAGFEAPHGGKMALPASDIARAGEWALVPTRNHYVALHTTRRVFMGRPESGWRVQFKVPDVGEKLKKVAIGTDFGLAVTELQ
ncbi:regulator of chromosome condensation 1/beta-lactamase-inhibitor protein II [Catenaria anguillulae PL171]|uniref:Regulator of chromosome condensation 1/beta-lactamase-inhibitor protein II n=1 Tax=Catenaria anguillulae PL171 TaxID=765915 RepID=A0A1Y2H5Y3_9FUNG|nr:regulator of chromosome condensation 1/beta-lactamase-inhibitor protein II [Catenaria anguillulae PL171]